MNISVNAKWQAHYPAALPYQRNGLTKCNSPTINTSCGTFDAIAHPEQELTHGREGYFRIKQEDY